MASFLQLQLSLKNLKIAVGKKINFYLIEILSIVALINNKPTYVEKYLSINHIRKECLSTYQGYDSIFQLAAPCHRGRHSPAALSCPEQVVKSALGAARPRAQITRLSLKFRDVEAKVVILNYLQNTQLERSEKYFCMKITIDRMAFSQ